MKKNTLEKAKDYILKHGEQDAYEFATDILYRLQGHGFCIWQTYTKDDIELNTGKRPSNKKMDDLQDRLENTFANDYLTD